MAIEQTHGATAANRLGRRAAAFALVLFSAGAAWSHGGPAKSEQTEVPDVETPYGKPGTATLATRSIRLEMKDTMRFIPDRIEVEQGETLRIVLVNHGALLHEMVIGTAEQLRQHADMMRRFPTMAHQSANMAHVPAGRTGEIVWTFTSPGEFQFACLLPGHFEAGMIGSIVVKQP